MKKIPTLFKRDQETHLVTDEITPGCEWVFDNGKVIPTRKYDGTAVLMLHNKIYKRYDCKEGKIPPLDFIPSQVSDENTGHWPGWVYCDHKDNENKYYYEVLRNMYMESDYNPFILIANGTYELIGPKINGNPEKIKEHKFIKHGDDVIDYDEFNDFKLTYFSIKTYLETHDVEGIVFYRDHVSMFTAKAKIKKKDFGLKR